MNDFIYWYKSREGLGDRIHHMVQLMELTEIHGVKFIVDMRDGMFGELGDDVFSKWLHTPHPNFIEHPDFEAYLDQYEGKLVPPRKEWFDPLPVAELHWRQVFIWQRWMLKSLNMDKWGGRWPWVRRQIRRVIPASELQALDSRKRVCSFGQFIRPERHPGCIHLYIDWIRKPKWSAERSVWPAQWVVQEIEATWPSLSFDPKEAVGVHIRQTDKTRSDWWEAWLEDLVSGVHFADRKFVFLATDSRRVLETFQKSPIKQQLICNPWLELPEEEKPLHWGNFNGEWVMKTALFDMWTLTSCRDFVPYKLSSFSRVVEAWRAFPPNY